jgi:hypothetical protein
MDRKGVGRYIADGQPGRELFSVRHSNTQHDHRGRHGCVRDARHATRKEALQHTVVKLNIMERGHGSEAVFCRYIHNPKTVQASR